MSLSASLARQLVGAALGGGAPLSARRFSGGQRGLVAGLLAAVLDRIGVDVELALGSSPPMDVPRVAVEVVSDRIAGPLTLEMPAEWFDPTGPSVEAVLDLASTTIARDEASALQPGDVVVFDRVKALAPSDARWTATLAVRGGCACVSLAADGSLRMERPFEPPPGAGAGAGEGDLETPAPQDSGGVLVVAELGRPLLRRWDVFTLGDGARLVSGARSSKVALRCDDQVVANGALIDVDGELAVQITALLRAPI